jgi:hypothetical protein
MSGIAGVYNRDGRPADPSLLRRMTRASPTAGRTAQGNGCTVR